MSPAGPSRPKASGEVIVEFTAHGGFLMCAAVDVDTGTEATAVGPVSAGRAPLERIALAKLKRALAARSTTH
jgi:hypothetical protein